MTYAVHLTVGLTVECVQLNGLMLLHLILYQVMFDVLSWQRVYWHIC